jgi:hypothetical protein
VPRHYYRLSSASDRLPALWHHPHSRRASEPAIARDPARLVTRQTVTLVPLDPVVRTAVQSYLEAVDAAAPGLVQSAYLTGSVTMNDFRQGASDVDLVAVCPAAPNEAHIEALAQLHRLSMPQVDVLYLTRDDLRSDPAGLPRSYSLQGTFHRDGAFGANPVTWRELQTHSFAVRAPSLEAGHVWFDADLLRSWNADNLEQYWRRQVDAWRHVDPTDELIRHEDGSQRLRAAIPHCAPPACHLPTR